MNLNNVNMGKAGAFLKEVKADKTKETAQGFICEECLLAYKDKG